MKGAITHYPWLGKVLLLAGIFLVAEVLFSYLALYTAGFLFPEANILEVSRNLKEVLPGLEADSVTVRALQYYQLVSSLGRFVAVTFFFLYLTGEPAASTLGLQQKVPVSAWLLTAPLMLFAALVTGSVHEWNQGIHLPAAWHNLETEMRRLEEQAQMLSEVFLGTTRVGGLLINVALIGVVAAVSEELFFRGLWQSLLGRWTGSQHWAIWISAFLFSFIHLQFYGFFPRLLLGALLGYLYLWSGSLWLAVWGHMVNNTVAVVLYFAVARGWTEVDPTESGPWWQALIALIPATLLAMHLRKTTWKKTG